MKKNEEDKLVNAIIALQQTMVREFGKINLSIQELRTSYRKLDESFRKLEERVNRLDDSFNKYARRNDTRVDNHETRIIRIENRPSVVSEPRANYKKAKKKK